MFNFKKKKNLYVFVQFNEDKKNVWHLIEFEDMKKLLEFVEANCKNIRKIREAQ